MKLLPSKREDDSIAEERSHYLQQQEGAGSSLGSSSEAPNTDPNRCDSDDGENYQ